MIEYHLVEAVNNGTIDVIVSDHKPEDEESKRLTFAQATTGASWCRNFATSSFGAFSQQINKT